jgi:hypothetical protein
LRGFIALANRGELLKRANTGLVEPSVNFVPDLETAHVRPYPRHDTSQIVPHHHGQPVLQYDLDLALARLHIQRIHAGCANLNQQLRVANRWRRNVLDVNVAIVAIPIEHCSFHEPPSALVLDLPPNRSAASKNVLQSTQTRRTCSS